MQTVLRIKTTVLRSLVSTSPSGAMFDERTREKDQMKRDGRRKRWIDEKGSHHVMPIQLASFLLFCLSSSLSLSLYSQSSV